MTEVIMLCAVLMSGEQTCIPVLNREACVKAETFLHTDYVKFSFCNSYVYLTWRGK